MHSEDLLVWSDALAEPSLLHEVQRRTISVDILFRIFEIILFCFVVAICYLVYAVESTYDLP